MLGASAPSRRLIVDVLNVFRDFFRDSPNARRVRAGEAVFRRGDPGDVMFVVLDGLIEVSVDGRTVESLEPGSLLGEMALVDEGPRSADAIATVDSTLGPVDQAWFLHMLKHSPKFGLHVMSVMAARLRRHMTPEA
jgi:CRP/FNR family transcriptional regulator, cyclic AMP receptor protein